MLNVKQSFSNQATTYDAYATIQSITAADLANKIPDVQPKNILDIGCGTGILTKKMAEKFPNAQIDAVDLSDDMIKILSFEPNQNINPIAVDYNLTKKEKKYDLVISNASLHWMDVPKAFKRIKQQLLNNGHALCSVFGQGTGAELKKLLPKVGRNNPIVSSQFLTKDDVASEAKKVFSNVNFESKVITLQFSSIIDLLRTQKLTGVNVKVAQDGLWTPRQIQALDQAFHLEFGRVQFSYDVVFLVM